MRKRVSWELIVGCLYLYFRTRKQAVARAIEERKEGHPIEMNRWEMIGDNEPISTPVDLDTLIAQIEAEERRIDEILSTPLPPLPQSVLEDVGRALSNDWYDEDVRHGFSTD